MRFIKHLLSFNSMAVSGGPSQLQLTDNSFNARACSFANQASFGDSYAAGLVAAQQMPTCLSGPSMASSSVQISPDCTNSTCARNTGAYGYLFAEKYVSNTFQFQACSGANTSVTLNQIYDTDLSNTDIVTIDVGGDNGNAFADLIEACVYLDFSKTVCDLALVHALDTVLGMGPDLEQVIQTIKAKAPPSTPVYLLGYAQFWGNVQTNATCQDTTLAKVSTPYKMAMNGLVDYANRELYFAASKTGAIYVDVDSNFEGSRLCDPGTPWFNYVLFGDDQKGTSTELCGASRSSGDKLDSFYHRGVFHPTLTGQTQGYLAALEQAAGCA